MDEIMILLPENLYILRDLENQDLITDTEQYSLYFKNFIYPYKEEYDIQIKCEYGSNLGNLWRIENFPDGVDRFSLSVEIYGCYGKKLAQKECTVNIIKKRGGRGKKLLCIGDSMTQASVYLEQVAKKVPYITTLGTRRLTSVNHEGRGGWTLRAYFNEYDDKNNIGTSPFLFPKGIDAKSYYGNKHFYDVMKRGGENKYWYRGFDIPELKEGMYYYDDGAVIKYPSGERCENPEFEFSFSKYMARFDVEAPDVVSILFGANEFQCCPFERLEKEKAEYFMYMEKMIQDIKKTCPHTAIIINLPVLGSDQYSWGTRLGCASTAKQYEFIIKTVAEEILQKYDGRQNENIYICPMLLVCSPETGFSKATSNENIYTDVRIEHGNNWVHPCATGYMQMGTALAGVVENICQKSGI